MWWNQPRQKVHENNKNKEDCQHHGGGALPNDTR